MDSTWNIDDVEPDIRAAAETAARRAGMEVGAWLNQTIRNAAAEQSGTGETSRAPKLPLRPSLLARKPGEAGGDEEPDAATSLQVVFESLQKLSRRIESAEAKTTAAIAPLAQQVDQLARQLDEIRAAAGASTAPVERAVLRLSERLQKIEQPDGGRKPRRGFFGFFG